MQDAMHGDPIDLSIHSSGVQHEGPSPIELW